MKKQEAKKSPIKEFNKEAPSKRLPNQPIFIPPPPKEALDLHLIMGDDASGEKLAQLTAFF